MTPSDCYYFGCWNEPGHFLHRPNGIREYGNRIEWFGPGRNHLDSTLAPRHIEGRIGYAAMFLTASREGFRYRSQECPQGQFLRHYLDTGYTAIAWWDRCQGDGRGACNSVFLLQGQKSSEEMVEALRRNFPHVVENLRKAGVELVEVFAVVQR